MKVLVTGGAGFIGKHLVHELLNEDFEVTVLDKEVNPYEDTESFSYYSINIEDNLNEIFYIEKPDFVIHLAAQVDVGQSLKDSKLDASTNILGTINILENCRKYGVKKIVYASSAAVYGNPQYLGIDEEHIINPVSFYGLSKVTAENYITLYSKLYGLSYSILRYANVYGPGADQSKENGVISIFINRMMEQKQPTIFGSGEQTRDFIYVKDVVAANIAAIKRGKNTIYNIGTNNGTSLNELVETLSRLLGTSLTPNYENSRSADIIHSYLQNQRAIHDLDWYIRFSLEEGLTETIEYKKSTSTYEVHK